MPCAAERAPVARRWLAHRHRRKDAAVDLYCFAHAGGSFGEYVRWSDDLPGVQVWGIKLPGRAPRLDEPPFTRMTHLVEALVTEVDFTGPFAFFGHSLGGMIAFEITKRLRELGLRQPEHLYVSSSPAPPVVAENPVHHLPDQEFLVEVERRWGALPEEVRADAELRAVALDQFRSDMEITETYHLVPDEPLDCPVTAFAGDRERADTHIDGWRQYARAGFEHRVFPGGHFYFRERRDDMLRHLRGSLLRARMMTEPSSE